MKKLHRKNIQDIYALTPMQEGMLFYYLKNPESDLYFEQLCLRICGAIVSEIFQKAWNFVAANNELLRTVFRWQKVKEPVQMVLKERHPEVRVFDLSAEQPGKKQQRLEEIRQADKGEKFDLTQAPFRVTLVKVAQETHEIIISNHHILYDGWSNGIILREFFTAYEELAAGKEAQRPVKTKFKEYVRWIKEQDQSEQEKFWRSYLAGFETPTEWSVKRPGGGESGAVENFKTLLDKGFPVKLEDFAREHKVTVASLLYSAYGILLQKYNNSDDVMFGVTSAGRSAKLKGIEDMVGLFINTLPLRIESESSEKVAALLKKVNEAVQRREEFETTPLVDIKTYSPLDSTEELFDSIVVIENYPVDSVALQGSRLKIETYSMFEKTNYDLTVAITLGEEIEINFIYNAALFSKQVVERLSAHFERLLRGLTAAPAKELRELDILSEQEKKQLLVDFNFREADYPGDKTIPQLFAEQVERFPENIALVGQRSAVVEQDSAEVQKLTFKQLDEETNRLAGHLLEKGVGENELIAIMAGRTIEMITGILSILKTGAGYVPLNPKAPAERTEYILEECGVKKLLTTHSVFDSSEQPSKWPGETILLDDLPGHMSNKSHKSYSSSYTAYVIFTSGSTGEPKGVPISHANFCPLMHWGYEHLGLGAQDRVAQNLSYYFDWSVWEIFIALTSGAGLYMVQEEVMLNPAAYVDFLNKNEITALFITPTQFQGLTDSGVELSSLKHLAIGAEKLSLDLVKRAFGLVSEDCRVYNMYGPTEATIMAAVLDIDKNKYDFYEKLSSIPIGPPIANCDFLILDKDRNPVPLEVPGELYIGGDSLSQGYLKNPELTAEKFVKGAAHPPSKSGVGLSSPISDASTPRTFYRTGDLCRWLEDGTVEFVGRIDFQVKVRGFRIEPGEIENRLLRHETVKEALALVRQYESGENYLCAYIVSNDKQQAAGSEEMREYLSHSLPDYMIPAYFVFIEQMPLNPNGKVDTKALPAPEIGDTGRKYAAPRDELEKQLATVWARVLSLEEDAVGIDDNFFECGGHSLKASRLLARIHKECDVELPLTAIFQSPTIRDLAVTIKKASPGRYSTIAPAETRTYYPLSPAQRRLFVLQQMDLSSTVYNISGYIPLQNEIDKRKLEETFKKLIRRHETLRTGFFMRGEQPVQQIHNPEEIEFKIEVINLATESTDDTEEKKGDRPIDDDAFSHRSDMSYMSHLALDFVRPFDLSRAPLLRVGLLTLESGECFLLVDMHHIICDGVSYEILIKEFETLYRGEPLPPLPIQYKDYACWQSGEEQKKALSKQETYWLKTFSGEIPVLDLPIDFVRPAVQSFEGDGIRFEIAPAHREKLRELTLTNNTSLFMVLTALFNVLLAKLSGQEDIVLGTASAGRRHADLEKIIGMFVNTLTLRNHPHRGKTFRQFLAEVKQNALEAFENQDYPFEELVEKVEVSRDTGRNPLFDVMFALNTAAPGASGTDGLLGSAGLYESRAIGSGTTKFDLTIVADDIGRQIFVSFQYCVKLFKRETISRFIAYFNKITGEILDDVDKPIGDIQIITAAEKEQILREFNDTNADYPTHKTIPLLFDEQVERTPDLPALVDTQGRQLTYRELKEHSIRLANCLQERGIGPHSIVGIMIERSIDMMMGIFAIQKAGGAYLPIATDYPLERKIFMLRDSGAGLLLTASSLYREIEKDGSLGIETIFLAGNYNEVKESAGHDDSPLPGETGVEQELFRTPLRGGAPGMEDVAYVIYTSGSTGKPKGVMIEHRAIVNRLHWMQRAYPIGSGDVILQKTPVVFDVSVWELFWWSFQGAALGLLAPGDEKDPAAIVSAVGSFAVTTMHFVPSMLNAFLDYLESAPDEVSKLKSLKQVFSSGEALNVSQVKRFYKLLAGLAGLKLINLYGPTEAAVDVSYFNCPAEGELAKVPIGKPIDNIQLYVLDKNRHLQPVGVNGELHIGGIGLARGYLNRPELTAEKFVNRLDRSYKSDSTYKAGEGAAHPPPESYPAQFLPITSQQSPITLYRTGDLARWLPDGNIEFLGRIDFQVKIRGFRIELEEIEKQLTSTGRLPIKEAVVTAVPDSTGDNRLIAYIIPDKKQAFTLLRQLELQHEQIPVEASLYEWPNGMPVYYLNRQETDFMYREIFTEQAYLKHGITLPEGACIFDVGANIGVFSLFVHRTCKDARIYSFEPLQPIYEILALNTSLYEGNFKTFNYGIGAGEGEAVFTYYPHATLLSGGFVDKDQDAGTVRAFMRQQEQEQAEAPGSSKEQLSEKEYDELLSERLTTVSYTCRLRSLSRVIEEQAVKAIDLLKIDVEKAEMDVLNGIKEEHWPLIRQVVIEVHEGGRLLDRVKEFLENKGFRITVEQDQLLLDTGLYNLYAVKEPFPGETAQIKEEPDTAESAVFPWHSASFLKKEAKELLKSRLPDYMVPAHFVLLPRFPLTPTGKIDRKALPLPEVVVGDSYTAPRNEIELRLAKIWSEVLALEQSKIGIDDNFFDLGGHSLKATVMAAKLHRELDVEISLSEVFKISTIRGLSEYVGRREKSKYRSIGLVEEREYYPLTSAQERLYLAQQMDKSNMTYNMPRLMLLEGELDKERMEAVFLRLIERHESFRASFHEREGEPVQKIHSPEEIEFKIEGAAPPANKPLRGSQQMGEKGDRQENGVKTKVFWGVEGGSHWRGSGTPHLSKKPPSPPEARETALEFIRPFDLTKAPLLRIGLIKTGEKEHILMVDMHHIISDGTSVKVFINDFMDLYAGKELVPLPLQYKDFSAWLHSEAWKDSVSKQEQYWLEQFAGSVPVLELPYDFPRPEKRSFAGASIEFEINGDRTEALRKLADEEDVTLFMVLLTVYKILLSKISWSEDIVVGSPVVGRRSVELQPIIGMFVNTVAFRSFPAGGKTFAEFLQEVKKTTLEAFENQDYPFDDLVEKVAAVRETSHNPLFDTMFTLQNIDIPEVELPGLKLKDLEYKHGFSRFDMTWLGIEVGAGPHSIKEAENKLVFTVEYSTSLFKEDKVRNFAGFFEDIVDIVTADGNICLQDIDIASGLTFSQRSVYEEAGGDFEFVPGGFKSKRDVNYIKWIKEQYRGEQEKFWKNYLAGFDVPTGWSVKRPGGRQTGAVGDFKTRLGKDFRVKLEAAAKENEVTSASLLYCAYGVLLQKYNNSADVIFGAAEAGRSAEIKGIEDKVRLFINPPPLRIESESSEKVIDLVKKVNEAVLERQEYETTPLADIKAYSPLDSTEELFDSIIVIENYPIDTAALQGGKLPIEPHSMFEMTNYDLTAAITLAEEIEINFIYKTGLFSETAVERLSGHFQRILQEMVAASAKELRELDILSEQEKKQLLVDFNFREADYPRDKTIPRLFAQQVERFPDSIALVGARSAGVEQDSAEVQKLTFKQLDEETNRLAGYLLEKGVGENELIAIMAGRTIEMITGILSILKTGAGYVPLNPRAPAERTEYILEECGVKKLLTTNRVFTGSDQPADWPGETILLDDLPGHMPNKSHKSYSSSYTAYVIFTSGSTGEPKGVPITHANFCPLMHWGYMHLGLGVQDRVVQNLSYYFDWSVWEVFIALTSGAGLYMVQEEVMLNSPAYVDFLNRNKITALFITPTQFQSLTDIGVELSSLKHLAIGAEKLSLDLVKRAFALVSEDCRVYNMYGPTEATIMAAVLDIDKNKYDFYEKLSSIPIGPPIANCDFLILDKDRNPVPLEVPGELYIGGDSLSRGYLKNPQLTAEKFINMSNKSYRAYKTGEGAAHPPSKSGAVQSPPASEPPKPRTFYRTGDLARWLVDGTVEFVGRIDFQVKIRGFRIEPGEIENRLLKHEAVKEALVLVRQYEGGENYLCAYIVAKDGEQALSGEAMREYLSHSLPDYMIPSYFVFIEQMPLNPNGKVDIKALPAPEIKSLRGYVPPGNKIEETLADIWSMVLKLDKRKIGIDDDFFELGGHSLSVTKLAGKIHKALDVEVPFSLVFTSPTIRGIAGYIEAEKKDEKHIEILPVEKKEYYPVSSAQRRFFLLQQMDPTAIAYNMSGIVQLDGPLEKEMFESGFKRLLKRHESLRTCFAMLGEGPVQKIEEPNNIEFEIEYYEVGNRQEASGISEEKAGNRQQAIGKKAAVGEKKEDSSQKNYAHFHTSDMSYMSNSAPESAKKSAPHHSSLIIHNSVLEFIRPFDLSRAPLLRVGLLKIEEEKHLLMVDMHHIISDGISVELLLRDFAALTAAKELPPLPVSYKDYTGWQNTRAGREMLTSQAAFWRQAFKGEIPVLELPTDYTRPAVQDFQGSAINFELTEEETRSLNRFSLEQQTTLFMTLLAIYTLFLSKITNQQDIVVGTPVSGRRLADIEPVVGLFVNTLALRNFVPVELTFAAFLAQVKERMLQAFENQDYPYEELVEKVVVNRDVGRNPLFDSMFVLQGAEIWEMEIPGLKRSHFPYAGRTSKFDLTLQAQHIAGKLVMSFEYSTRLFKPGTIERFISYFKKIVHTVLANPGKTISGIEIIPGNERSRIIKEFNHPLTEYPEKTLVDLFEEQAERMPDQKACLDKENYVTFEDLDNQADVLAKIIKEL